MNWSARQVTLLQGMGFDTLQLRGANDFARAPVGAPAGPAAGAAAAATASPSRPAPRAPAVAAGSQQTDARPVSPAVATTGKLLAALRLAAGGRDPLALAGDLDALRRDPARKRALWPRLRALRRQH